MINADDIVLVTGGTGFTGTVLLQQLAATGCTIRAIARKTSKRESLSHIPIEWIEGNIYDSETIEAASESVNYVINLAAAYREAKIQDHVYHDVHVKGTQLLARACLKNQNFKRFLHVSTVGVHGHIDTPPANENTDYNPGDIYQETKTIAEKWLIDFSNAEKLPITIVRPAAIYGPGDHRLLKIFKFGKLPIAPLIGYTQGLYHLIHVDDLCRFILLAASETETLGQIYICGNAEATSIKEIIETTAERLGRKPRFLRLPAWPFFLLGDICEKICKPLGIEPPIYRRRVAFFTKDRSFNTEKMRSIKNFSYKFDNKSGIKNTVDWYLDSNWL